MGAELPIWSWPRLGRPLWGGNRASKKLRVADAPAGMHPLLPSAGPSLNARGGAVKGLADFREALTIKRTQNAKSLGMK